MHPGPNDESTPHDQSIEVAKADILAAWSVLENLAVSMDQIGGHFGDSDRPLANDSSWSVGDALRSYLDPNLVQKIAEARSRLSRYVPDADAEVLTEEIPYWDYSLIKSKATG